MLSREMIFYPDGNKPYQQPEAKSIHQLLKMMAERKPDDTAVAAPERQPLTYGLLLNQVERTVGALRWLGLKRNDRVAIVLPNGPEMAVAFLAVAAGATCAPLNPSYRAKEFDFYMSDLNARALVVWSDMDSPAREIARSLSIPIVEINPNLSAEAGVFELAGTEQVSPAVGDFAGPDDTALVLHTSGTTSRPKIVPLTHLNICNSGHNVSLILELSEKDRCLNVMPLFHIHGLIGAVLSSLTAGASVVCTPGIDVSKFFEWVTAFQPSWYSAVPTMHQAILLRALSNRDVIERHPFRFIRSCSASLPAKVMSELEETFKAPVIESYGMTEASHQMTSNPLPPLVRKAGSVGVAAGPDVAIMDEACNLLPAGEVGEIVIRGINVTNGYENNPAANQSAFSDGWFRTGDQGRFDTDGYLFITGRIKEIINRGGLKIAPKEVDEILMQHPAVAQAIAFAVPHPTLGEDIAAAVVLNKDAAVSESEIRDFAAVQLADYKVPSQVLFLDEIPKGPTGKLQRIGLAEKLSLKLKNNFVAPSSMLEIELAEIWKELLSEDQVGVRDNFFLIGGDSLAVVVMMSEVEKRFNTEIPLSNFLRAPTIETIVGLLQKKESSENNVSVNTGGTGGFKPISDSFWGGIKNRILQVGALYAPGFKTTRVWLHRMRGVAIGKNVSIGLSALIETAYPSLISIGNNVTIGMRAIIIGHLRDLTAQARVSGEPTVRIEDDVYIGPGVIVLPNVTIGQGAVVSAGSVVSRSVPPRTLVQGNPAIPVAHCGVSLGGGVSYEKFLRHLKPIKDSRAS
jgi:acyl-CoA synthetase (AMP-forming)/AMP-acid ligase II/acetyltransferase-like isoleucine patch superfamily enzyme/acyl carrier protein